VTQLRLMRMRHLVGAMLLEEKLQRARQIPSSYTLLKAEYGFTGNRAEVLHAAIAAAKEEPDHVGD
jgi:hypothetical protein